MRATATQVMVSKYINIHYYIIYVDLYECENICVGFWETGVRLIFAEVRR